MAKLLNVFKIRLHCLLVTPRFGWPASILILAVLIAQHDIANAQAVSNASVTGEVVDQNGGAVVGAEVVMTETERSVPHQTTTDSAGRYVLPNLPVGPYRLNVTASGFKTHVQTGIVLQVGDNSTLNVSLELGTVTQSVEVSADAAMVQSEKTSVSQVISQKDIVDLPLNGRQATQLVLISGAATVTPAGDMSGSKNYASSTTISIAGGQGSGTNYILDGGDNTDAMTNVNLPFPFPDALQEFSVDTNALPARNGTQPGGVVNIITKSGTNEFHGDVFEFLRNGDVNARNFFAATHDNLKRNQFGGTLGGRVVRDKLFFFGGYQGTRIINVPPSSIAFILTAAELAGNFTVAESAACQASGRPRTITLSGTKTPITNLSNVFASGVTFDPAAVKLASFLPVGAADQCGKVVYAIPTKQNEDQGVGRVDWVRSSKNSIFGRYFRTKFFQPAFFDPTDALVTQNPGNDEGVHAVTLGDTYTFGPTVINSFHATFTRRTDFRGGASNFFNATDLGINISVAVPNDFRLAVTPAASGFAVGCGTCSPGHFNVNSFQFADDVDIIRGAHHFSAGVDYIRDQLNVVAGYLQNGNIAFNGSATGDSILDFLTGTMSSYQQSLPQQPSIRMSIPALYVQDTIHATSHLTVNAGVRWEPNLWPYDQFKRGATFSLANFLNGVHSSVYSNAPAGALYVGDPGVPQQLANNRYWNFSPRLGLAWDPRGDGRQTVRVGAAIMYDVGALYTPQRNASDPPFVNEIDLATSKPLGLSNPWTTGYNYPGGNPFPPTGTFFPQYGLWILIPKNLHPITLYQWNATYQRQIGADWLASISYLGNRTAHLWLGQELNPAIYSPSVCAEFTAGCTTGNTNQRKSLEQINFSQGQYYGNVDVADDGANASYNALLASVNKRVSHSVALLANYTWSRCISDGDFGGDITGPGYQNPYNRRADRGDCNFDIRHIFNSSIIFTSSIKGSRLFAHVLNNWQIAPLIRALSGFPGTILTGTDASLTGIGLDRPNLVPGVDTYASTLGPKLQWLNPAAFTPNTAGTYGNLGRDTIRLPGQLLFDSSLSRIFALRESIRLEVRGEAFNVINHTNLAGIPTSGLGLSVAGSTGLSLSRNAANFGQITSAGDPRTLQFAMKLYF